MKSILKPSLAAVLILAALFACAKKNTDGGGLRSRGDITVNKNQFDGSVRAGTQVLYTLKDIHQNQNYTLRTEIALKSDGSSTSPDGTLTVNIYSSADAFRNDPASPVRSAVALPAPNSNIYEVYFPAPSSGDFVVVINGESDSVPGIQFFYNLRLMSADPLADPAVLSSFTTTTIPASAEQLVNPLNPGYLNIYNGGAVSSSDTFTITLKSNATTTLAYPQMFVYLDSKLTVTGLMVSSIPTTTEFVITKFDVGVPTDVTEQSNTDLVSGVTVSGVTFTSGAGGGPFIVLKGSAISAVTYTLSIGP